LDHSACFRDAGNREKCREKKALPRTPVLESIGRGFKLRVQKRGQFERRERATSSSDRRKGKMGGKGAPTASIKLKASKNAKKKQTTEKKNLQSMFQKVGSAQNGG